MTNSAFFSEWNQVCLFRERNGLAFSTTGRTGAQTRFKPYLDLDFALSIVTLFKRTIGAILRDDTPNAASFIPLLLTENKALNAQIALFGRVSTPAGELKGLRWGIYYPLEQREDHLPVQDEGSKEYVRWYPPSLDLAENLLYFKRFNIKIDTSPAGNITKISLTYNRTQFEIAQKCDQAIKEYLLNPQDQVHHQVLKQLGLAPEQIAGYCTEAEWAYFRKLTQQLDKLPRNESELVFGNLKLQYPRLHEVLLGELIARYNRMDTQNEEYTNILATLKNGVIGQEYAAEVLATGLASQKNNGRKKIVYLFVGPTGVGKTELAKVAATMKHNRIVTFHMNHFQDQNDSNKLFGSPSGYVGSTDKPMFAAKMQKFISESEDDGDIENHTIKDIILVFDEFEKAHTDVKQTFLTLFDEGHCQVQYSLDRKNCVINYIFENVIIICTSNLYSKEIQEAFHHKIEPRVIGEQFVSFNKSRPTKNSYSPELLGRMILVPFGPIPKGEVYQRLLQSKLTTHLADLQKSLSCPRIEIQESDKAQILQILENTLYGDGTGVRAVKDYFEIHIANLIYKQRAWGNLSDKVITFVRYNSNRLGLKCIRSIYGEVITEFPVVPI